MHFFDLCLLLAHDYFILSGISCDPPLIPKYGKLKEVSSHHYFKSIVTYECNKGYDMIGKSTMECLLNKAWSGTVPVCQGKAFK